MAEPEIEPKTIRDLPWLNPETKERFITRGLLFLAAAAIFLPFIGSFGLWDPWETHYGEVGRQITERNDWISTCVGSHWKDAGGSQEGTYFYSKPILLMWLMAMGISVFGVSEIGIRIGVALVSILALVLIYSMGASVFRKRTGLVMAGVVGTSPLWFFLSRQAQTDMPFVGLMTIGMCFFMMGVFGKDREEAPDKTSYLLIFGWLAAVVIPQFTLLLAGLSRWRGAPNSFFDSLFAQPIANVAFGGTLLVVSALLLIIGLWKGKRKLLGWSAVAVWVVPNVAVLIGVMIASTDHIKDLNGWYAWGPVQIGQYALLVGLATFLTFARPKLTRGRIYLYGFYIFVGLATLAKGLLGFMLPGAILLVYILVTRRWRMLKDVELINGIAIFIAVTFPWYAAMLIRHTSAFWNRFFVHDHFKRLATGVHQIDTGSFEHFAKWLGYGLFPWSAYVPALVARAFGGEPLRKDETERHAVFMLIIWMVVAFTLFTLSSTKFHHYIFPAMPAIGMLIAL